MTFMVLISTVPQAADFEFSSLQLNAFSFSRLLTCQLSAGQAFITCATVIY